MLPVGYHTAGPAPQQPPQLGEKPVRQVTKADIELLTCFGCGHRLFGKQLQQRSTNVDGIPPLERLCPRASFASNGSRSSDAIPRIVRPTASARPSQTRRAPRASASTRCGSPLGVHSPDLLPCRGPEASLAFLRDHIGPVGPLLSPANPVPIVRLALMLHPCPRRVASWRTAAHGSERPATCGPKPAGAGTGRDRHERQTAGRK